MSLPNDLERKFAIINALTKLERPSLHDLHQETRIPESTLKRQLGQIRGAFRMDIRFVRKTGQSRGAKGYYELADWGIVDREAFLQVFSEH